MSTKKILVWSLVGGLVFGFVIVYMGLMAADTSQWYQRVNSVSRSRVVIVDPKAENTVMIVDIVDGKAKVTYEP